MTPKNDQWQLDPKNVGLRRRPEPVVRCQAPEAGLVARLVQREVALPPCFQGP